VLGSPARIDRYCAATWKLRTPTSSLAPKTGSHASARYIQFSEPTTPWIIVISTCPYLIVNGRLGITRLRLPASPTWTLHRRPAACVCLLRMRLDTAATLSRRQQRRMHRKKTVLRSQVMASS